MAIKRYKISSQVMVQRNLAAKDVSHSKGACVITSYLKLLPFFLFVWPGMVSRILYPGTHSYNQVYPNPLSRL